MEKSIIKYVGKLTRDDHPFGGIFTIYCDCNPNEPAGRIVLYRGSDTTSDEFETDVIVTINIGFLQALIERPVVIPQLENVIQDVTVSAKLKVIVPQDAIASDEAKSFMEKGLLDKVGPNYLLRAVEIASRFEELSSSEQEAFKDIVNGLFLMVINRLYDLVRSDKSDSNSFRFMNNINNSNIPPHMLN